MKKRMLSAIFATGAALCCAAGLTACGDDDKGADKPSDDGVLRSEKIDSATAWATAMDFSDVTNGSIVISGMEGRVYKLFIDGDKEESVIEELDGTPVRTTFYEYKAGEVNDDPERLVAYCYRYDDETSKWTVDSYELYDRNTLYKFFKDGVDYNLAVYDEEAEEMTGCLHDRYAGFSYDDSKYAYVASYDAIDYMTDIKVEVKFKNGKLAQGSMSCTMENENGETVNSDITFEIFDLGTTEVTIPQVLE